MRRLLTYSEYRDSGIEWLGRIPEHWNLKRLKHVIAEPLKYGANEAASLDDPDLPRYVRITDIDDSDALRAETFRSLPRDVAEPHLLEQGDLLLARSGATVGKTFLYQPSWGACAYAGYLIRARLDRSQVRPRFARYFTASETYWQWLSSALIQATIQNVSAEKYAQLRLPIPPSSEQDAILSFLDRETEKIDALVEKKERLIELLQEKRTALITRAVTQGLDPNVPMRDSGIEWLGQIPAHWKACFLGRFFSVQGGFAFRSDDFVADGIPVIRMSNLKSGVLDTEDAVLVEPSEALVEFALQPGDLVVGMSGSLTNYAWIREEDTPCQLNQRVGRVRSRRDRDLVRYATYVLESSPSSSQIEVMAVGTAQQNISAWQIEHIQFARPPSSEQQAIADFLDHETAKIDALIAKVQEAIERLKEYRTALISAAVTGKIDVRGLVEDRDAGTTYQVGCEQGAIGT